MADLKSKFVELTTKPYIGQAHWFLNGFWKDGAEKEAEQIWKYAQKFIELDPKKKEGNELDEFWSHKFLESLGETLTVIQLREKLRAIDMDVNGKVALIEYLCFRYGKSVQQVVNAPQGDGTEVAKAQAVLNQVQTALAQVQLELEESEKALKAQTKAEAEAREAEAEAKRTAAEAKKALDAQKEAEDTVRKSEEELRAAVDELKKQEEGYQNQLKTLETKSKDTNSTIVARNKAAAELAQLKQEDPLPLRKAKISQEAALRKVEKERKAAEAATDIALGAATRAEKAASQAEEALKQAQKRKNELIAQKERVAKAVAEAEEKVQEALAAVEDAKNKGSPLGAIWWMEREIKEAQKYLPQRKQQK